MLTTRELADYLRLNERTVLKLASQGELPGVRLGNQWRFRRSVVDVWLDDQMLGVRSTETLAPSQAPPTFSFDEGFRPEHVVPNLDGSSVSRVLEELAAGAHELGLVRDKTWMLGALLERENLLTSAVGDGVAFPHTLRRHPEQIRRPFFMLGRSQKGVDFGAPDGKPVHIIVMMGLVYEELHLPWLRRLSAALRASTTRTRIMKASAARAIYDVLVDALP